MKLINQVIFFLLGSLIALAGLALSDSLYLKAGQPPEPSFLIQSNSALREIGYDANFPYLRIADRHMSFTYELPLEKGGLNYLLLRIQSQFKVSAAPGPQAGENPRFTLLASCLHKELAGTQVFCDLTPFAQTSDRVLLKFEDYYPADGWGALLEALRLVRAGPGQVLRLALTSHWHAGKRPYLPGQVLKTAGPVTFSLEFVAPDCWQGHALALYFADFTGAPDEARLNGKALHFKRTWDLGYWCKVTDKLRPGRTNRLEVRLTPENGEVGLWRPVRVGLALPACVAPSEKRLGERTWALNHNFAPYDVWKLNWLAGNYMQALYDERYDLLAFKPGETMPVHFVHDTCRSVQALANEARFAPVVRLALVQRLYRGIKRAILPGGDYLFAFKHDERPVALRPLPQEAAVTTVYKTDTARESCAIAPVLPAPVKFEAPPTQKQAGHWRFKAAWSSPGRKVEAVGEYFAGDSDRAPSLTFRTTPSTTLKLRIGTLSKSGRWFIPGSWGPEYLVLPDGRELEAKAEPRRLNEVDFSYLLIRGDSSGAFTWSRALLIAWDQKPSALSFTTIPGGPGGRLFSDLVLEFPPSAQPVKLWCFPFAGYTHSLHTPRALADNLLKTGRFGAGCYDVASTCNQDGVGPGGLAAAAWLFEQYHTPEAAEARTLAKQAFDACRRRDRAGVHSNQCYYLLNGCEYMVLLDYQDYRAYAAQLGDRILAQQAPDGSFTWLNFQFRNMIGLWRAWKLTGERRFLQGFQRALKTLAFRDGVLYWKDRPVTVGDDFTGALPVAIYGALGDYEALQAVLKARKAYVDDRGFQACSDLNPYMLGFSLRAQPASASLAEKLLVPLGSCVRYSKEGAVLLARPSCYFVNSHTPLAENLGLGLPSY